MNKSPLSSKYRSLYGRKVTDLSQAYEIWRTLVERENTTFLIFMSVFEPKKGFICIHLDNLSNIFIDNIFKEFRKQGRGM